MRGAPISRLRVAARLANAFALDLVKLGGFGRDVLDGLLLAAISQANVAQITRSPELQRRYATLDSAPPDNMRRPVSINALATSLRIPFETARRRVMLLRDARVVQISRAGVIVPRAPLDSPFYRMGAEGNYLLVRNLYRRLRGIGLLEDLAHAPMAYDGEAPPLRLVMRLSSDYVLRMAEALTGTLGDLVTGLVLMDMIHANTEHLPDSEGGNESEGTDGFVPDDERLPVRIAALAERLGIAAETVRRHVARLEERGLCLRSEAGCVVPAEALARAPFQRYMLDNQVNLQRLFQALADYGVVETWEREDVALRGAA